jgi:hypothetical protein
MLNENVAYAKSILAKKGIVQGSPEWEDYLKIRQICGNDNGYVGILTKIRFMDEVTDFDELKSIFDILKNSKIDTTKMNKMSYSDILNTFYDELSGEKTKNKDYELIYRDSQYYYYKVYTYQGILKISSPAWCLKTKKHWDDYQSKYPQQWVVISKKYQGKLITPDDNYLSEYKSAKGFVRYGISIHDNEDDTFSWVAFNDNNGRCEYSAKSWTFFGVLSTIMNLKIGKKKSYYERFLGCKTIEGSKYLKVVNKRDFLDRFRLSENTYDDCEIYVKFSESYSSPPLFILMNGTRPITAYPLSWSRGFSPAQVDNFDFSTISEKESKNLFEMYATEHPDLTVYFGIRLKLGLMTMEQIQAHPKFIKLVGKWAIFDKKNYYQIVNTTNSEYQVPCMTLKFHNSNMDDPMYFYIHKDSLSPVDPIGYKKMEIKDFQKEVIEELKSYIESKKPPVIEEPKLEEPKLEEPVKEEPVKEEPKEEPKPEKKVKGFWDFLKR